MNQLSEQVPDTLAASIFAEMEAMGTPLSATDKAILAMEEAKLHLRDAISGRDSGNAEGEAVAKGKALAALSLIVNDDDLIDEMYEQDDREYWAAVQRGELDE